MSILEEWRLDQVRDVLAKNRDALRMFTEKPDSTFLAKLMADPTVGPNPTEWPLKIKRLEERLEEHRDAVIAEEQRIEELARKKAAADKREALKKAKEGV